VLAVGLVLAFASPRVAAADVTLGSTTPPTGSTSSPCASLKIAQAASDPSTPYTVPSQGTITSWRVNTNLAPPGAPVTMFVLRPSGGSSYTVIGTDTQTLPNPFPPVAGFTISSPIAAKAGDILGVYDEFANIICAFQGGATPLTDVLVGLGPPGAP